MDTKEAGRRGALITNKILTTEGRRKAAKKGWKLRHKKLAPTTLEKVKKAKLIRNGGFYKIISLSGIFSRVDFPMFRGPTIEFKFDRIYRGIAEYREALPTPRK
jgi:hypothetical protein